MSTLKTAVIFIGVGALAAGAAYGIGRVHGGARIETIKNDARVRYSQCRAELKSVRRKLATSLLRETHLAARRQLHLSLDAIDDRNFGVAQGHLDTGVRLLRALEGREDAATELAELASDIASTKIVAAGNFQEQHESVRSFVKALDDLTPVADSDDAD